MKTKKVSKTLSEDYISLITKARTLQSDLLNIIDENLLTMWSTARGGNMLAVEIRAEMERFLEDSYYNLNPVCVNLIEMILEIVELQEKSVALRSKVYLREETERLN